MNKGLDKEQKVVISKQEDMFAIPWFKKYCPEIIEQYANAYRKADFNFKELLKNDKGNPPNLGVWHFFSHR